MDNPTLHTLSRFLDEIVATSRGKETPPERIREARSRLQAALSADSSLHLPLPLPDVARKVGGMLLDAQCFPESATAYRCALAYTPDSAGLHNDLALALLLGGRENEGIAALHEAVRHDPGNARWHLNLGNALASSGAATAAITALLKAAELDGRSVEPWLRLGDLLLAEGRGREAHHAFQRALAQDARSHAALLGLARSAESLGDLQQCCLWLTRFAESTDNKVQAYDHVAGWLRTSGHPPEAAQLYRKAVELAPRSAELRNNLAVAYMDANDNASALSVLQAALALNPDLANAHHNLATVLNRSKDYERALEHYRRAARLRSDFLHPRLEGMSLARVLASWKDWDAEFEKLCRIVPQSGNAVAPFDFLFLPVGSEALRMHAEAYARETAEPVDPSWAPPRRPVAGQRIRIGYVTDEMRMHAVGTLAVEAFELHDKARFEVHLYTWGPRDGSSVETRARSSVASVHDISTLSSPQAAAKIAADGIDILIDLKGYTLKPRLGIFAHRPAPVQVTWLGYPGTLGTQFIDYLIADPFIVPAGDEKFYTEKIVRLADTYQPNDRQRRAAPPGNRTDYGLPEQGIVYCYLGKPSKIIPEVFDDWMRIVAAVPHSVLWLLTELDATRTNLTAEAEKRGIPASQLRFAGLAGIDQHLARFKVADVALDTFPYGSHTTASEALWQGCPLVTRVGETFASRVAGSLLQAAGAPELITSNREEFRRLAIELGLDTSRRRSIRSKLEASRSSSALFDTTRFVRNLEAAYEQMHARAAQGLPPTHLAIEAAPHAGQDVTRRSAAV